LFLDFFGDIKMPKLIDLACRALNALIEQQKRLGANPSVELQTLEQTLIERKLRGDLSPLMISVEDVITILNTIYPYEIILQNFLKKRVTYVLLINHENSTHRRRKRQFGIHT